jgi:hypothetical protein
MAKFSEFSQRDKTTLIKSEFSLLVKTIFENPDTLKALIAEKQIDNNQSKQIWKKINDFNSKTCVCCRRFDTSKMKLFPIEPELEPLIDVARTNAEKKKY